MMNEMRDPQLEAWYRGGAGEEPPPALDAAILAAAHRAVGAGPTPLARRTSRSWMMPVAAAAVLVLSVTLIRFTPQEEVLPEVSAPPAAPPPPAGAPGRGLEATGGVRPAEAPVIAATTAAPPSATAAAGAKAKTEAPKIEARVAAAPTAAVSSPARPLSPPAAVVPSEEVVKAAPIDAGTVAAQRKGARLAQAEQKDLPRSRAFDSAPSPRSLPLAAPPALAATEARSAVPAPTMPPLRARQDKQSAAEPNRLAAAGAGVAPQSGPDPGLRESPPDKEKVSLAPEAWIAKLLSLQAAGPDSEFLKELAAFRQVYPRHPLPASLQAALSRLPGPPPRPFPDQAPR